MAAKPRPGVLYDADFDEEIPKHAKSRGLHSSRSRSVISVCLRFARIGSYLSFTLIAFTVIIFALIAGTAIIAAVAHGLGNFFEQLTGLFSLLTFLAMLIAEVLWLLIGHPESGLMRFFELINMLGRYWEALQS